MMVTMTMEEYVGLLHVKEYKEEEKIKDYLRNAFYLAERCASDVTGESYVHYCAISGFTRKAYNDLFKGDICDEKEN